MKQSKSGVIVSGAHSKVSIEHRIEILINTQRNEALRWLTQFQPYADYVRQAVLVLVQRSIYLVRGWPEGLVGRGDKSANLIVIIRCFGLLTQNPRKRDNSKESIFRLCRIEMAVYPTGARCSREMPCVNSDMTGIYASFNRNLTPTSWAQCVQLLFHFIRWYCDICSTFSVSA